MLRVSIEGSEFFDESKQEFQYVLSQVVTLEHSLLSLSKWESKWKKPLLSNLSKVKPAELLDYFHCMEVEPADDPMWVLALTPTQQRQIADYINEEQTATTFYSYRESKSVSREIITSEIIYYWMMSLNIPFTCETWHLSRLLTLIRVASIKGQSGKKTKMSQREILEHNRRLNEERRRKYNTRG